MANNGLDALQLMRRRAPDALVLDLMMPIMNATGLLEQMRLDRRLARIPVVVMSAAT
jgi:CheY-like chemotaxis protein